MDFWYLARAPGPPNFLGSFLLGSATNRDLSNCTRISLISCLDCSSTYFWYLARAPGPPNFLGSFLLGSATNRDLVKLHKDILDLLLRLLVNVLLVVSDQGLGQRLSDGVHLASVAATLNADPDVNIGKPVLAEEQNGLLQLEAQSLRLDKLQRATIHLDQSLSALAISHSSGRLLAPKDLDRLNWLLGIISHD